MTLLTVDEIRELVETDLSDTALGVIVDAAEGDIVEMYGAASTATERFQLQSGSRHLTLSRAASSVTTVKRQGLGELDAAADTIASTEWEQEGSRRIRLLAGQFWSTWVGVLITVAYVPTAEVARRKLLQVNLVKLACMYQGVSASSMGDLSVTHAAYAQERAALLASHGTMTGSFA